MTETYIDIPPQKTLAELGLDAFGQSPIQFFGVEVNKKAPPIEQNSVSPNAIQSGEIVQKISVAEGWIQSSNYVAATTGWRLNADGTSELN